MTNEPEGMRGEFPRDYAHLDCHSMAERESWSKATVQCAASERREVIETNGASIFLLVLIISLVVTIAIVARFGLARILWAIANLIWFFILFIFIFLAVIVVIALLL